MDIAQWFKDLIVQWRHDKKPHGPTYAARLRKELRDIAEKGLGRISAEREITLPTAFSTVRETIRALVGRRVTLDDLEPDIGYLDDIIHWLRYHASADVHAGKLSWSDFGFEGELAFRSKLLDLGVAYDLLRFHPERIFGGGMTIDAS